jgi:hypothetical protein
MDRIDILAPLNGTGCTYSSYVDSYLACWAICLIFDPAFLIFHTRLLGNKRFKLCTSLIILKA